MVLPVLGWQRRPRRVRRLRSRKLRDVRPTAQGSVSGFAERILLPLRWLHPTEEAVYGESPPHSVAFEHSQAAKGLFKPDGEPVFPEGMRIVAHNVNATVRNRLRTPRLVIIEFSLRDLPTKGSPGQLLHLSLVPNYALNPLDLRYEHLMIDIRDATTPFDKHRAAVQKVVDKLREL